MFFLYTKLNITQEFKEEEEEQKTMPSNNHKDSKTSTTKRIERPKNQQMDNTFVQKNVK
ncbi:hypothetical protein PP707_07285 [Acetobacter pasteurianus]|nr:hypothetical protein [Acetobacter pasteurianus]